MKKTAAALLLLLLPFGLLAQTDIYSRPIQAEPSHAFDVQHYRISLTFDLEKKTLDGSNLITIKSLKNGLNQVILNAENMKITAAESVEGRQLQFSHQEDLLTVQLAENLGYGKEFTFRVFYNATNSQKGIFFDDETEDHPRMVSTDSWPNEARTWYPCYDYPHDKVTHEVIITVDQQYKALSNGKLVSVTNNKDGTKTWHWHQLMPHSTYLSMLAVGPFEVVELGGHTLPMAAWVYTGKSEQASYVFRKTGEMIKFYEQLFDFPYPWAKYDQVTTPHVGGGAEATSATILGQATVKSRQAEAEYSSESLIAHEIAHHWWGNLITLRTWSHTWMNESFGTYSDYLWTRHASGEDEGAYDLLGKKNRYLREAHSRYIRPIVFNRYDQPGDNFDSHTYPKGAVTLHMLRFLMGDTEFFATLSHFLKKHAFQPVDTHDLKIAIKEATGQNYDWFFEQFVFSPGHMVLDISKQWDPDTKLLKLRVKQVQDFSIGVPVYKMKVLIGITTGSGEFEEEIWLRKKDESFEFELEEEPLLVRFDQGNYLLKEWEFRKPLAELIYQSRHDDAIGRLWAVRQIARFEDHPQAIETLKLIAGGDSFWAVRREAIQVLAKLEFAGKESLYHDLLADASFQVRSAVVQAIGANWAAKNVSTFTQVYEQDQSLRVKAAALTAMGKTGDSSLISLLEEASKIESHRNVIARAAKGALDQLNNGEE